MSKDEQTATQTRCGLCGRAFEPEDARQACRGCPMSRWCGMIKCPHCGYEMPPPRD